MKVLGVVPARGGSKSIPRKNLKMLDGHPLIAYSIACGLSSKTITRLVTSTEDPEIADVARRYGAEVPYLRPSSLAQDETPDLPVFQHLLCWLQQNEDYQPEILVHLRPTSPLRTVVHVDAAVSLLIANPIADSVRSVAPPLQNPYKMWRIEHGLLQPLLSAPGLSEAYNRSRQELPSVYWQTGYVDVTRWNTVMLEGSMTGKNVVPLVLNSSDSTDIDSLESFEWAEYQLRRGCPDVMRPRLLHEREQQA